MQRKISKNEKSWCSFDRFLFRDFSTIFTGTSRTGSQDPQNGKPERNSGNLKLLLLGRFQTWMVGFSSLDCNYRLVRVNFCGYSLAQSVFIVFTNLDQEESAVQIGS